MNVTTFFENNLKVILPELFILLSVSTLLLVGVQYSTSGKHGYPVVVKPVAWMSTFTAFLGILLVINNPFNRLYTDDISLNNINNISMINLNGRGPLAIAILNNSLNA